MFEDGNEYARIEQIIDAWSIVPKEKRRELNRRLRDAGKRIRANWVAAYERVCVPGFHDLQALQAGDVDTRVRVPSLVKKIGVDFGLDHAQAMRCYLFDPSPILDLFE